MKIIIKESIIAFCILVLMALTSAGVYYLTDIRFDFTFAWIGGCIFWIGFYERLNKNK